MSRKCLFILLLITLSGIALSQPQYTSDPAGASKYYYSGYTGGELPHLFTTVVWLTPTLGDDYPDYDFTVNSNGGITGEGDVYIATALYQLDFQTAASGRYFEVKSTIVSGSSVTIHVKFAPDRILSQPTSEVNKFALSVIMIDENFNEDGTGSYIYARNSLLTDIQDTGFTGQFDFEWDPVKQDSPFNYQVSSQTQGCGAVKTSSGNVQLQTAGCALANFYPFITGAYYLPSGTSTWFVDAQLAQKKPSTSADCLTEREIANYRATTDYSRATDPADYIYKENPSDSNVGLWINYCASLRQPIFQSYSLQVSFIFVGIRSFDPLTYPTVPQPLGAIDSFNFYAAYSKYSTALTNRLLDAVDPLFDVSISTTADRWQTLQPRTYEYAHVFCGFHHIGAPTAIFDPRIQIVIPEDPNADIIAQQRGSLKISTFCIFLEKKQPCVASYTGLSSSGGPSSILLQGDGTPTLITSTALQQDSVTTADPGFASSASLTNVKFTLDPAASDKTSITFTFGRTSPPTEYIIYAQYTVKGTAGADQLFTPSIIFNGMIVASEEASVTVVSDPVSSSLQYSFHSTDVAQNSVTFVYEDVAGENTFTGGYMQFGVYSINAVLDETVCTNQCPEKAGFTVGTNSSTTPPTCQYCETGLNQEYSGLNGGTCACIQHYTLNTDNLCVACAGDLCATCVFPSTDCLTCVEHASLVSTPAPSACACDDGFYKQDSECKSCPFGCLTCSSATICITCVASVNADSQTTRNQPILTCACLPGFYENGVDAICPPCDISCQTCSGPAATNCLSCFTNDNFQPVTADNTCICETGFYSLRTTSGVTCEPCSPQCLECDISSTYCTKCSLADHRELSGTSQPNVFTCACIQGYSELYGECVDNTCKNIDEFCQECLYDPVSRTTACLTCIDNREVVNGFCECAAGFYEMDNKCEACGSGCQFCLTATKCDDCALGSVENPDGTCTCQGNTVLQGSAGTLYCATCSSSCLTCVDTPSKCLTCASGFTFNRILNTCECPAGTFVSANGAQCLPCKPNCILCTDLQSECTCDVNYVWDTSAGRCSLSCPTGTYNSGSSCSNCPDTCADCVNPFICVSCKPGLFLFAGSCRAKCPDGTFSSNGECFSCSSPCKTCSTSPTSCTSCTSGFLYFNGQCVVACPDGTYYGDQSCRACSPLCLTCTGTSSTCKSCASNSFLYSNKCYAECPVALVEGKCTDQCPSGTFLSGNTCQECDTKCQGCAGSSTNCTACSSGSFSYGGDCVTACPAGTFENGPICAICDSSCASCSVNRYNCVSCSNGYVLSGSTCIPGCAEGYYLDSDNACRQCGVGCLKCFASSVCSVCRDPSLTPVNGVCQKSCPTGSSLLNGECACNFGFLFQGACVSKCPEGQYSINRVCQPCSYPCTACISTSTFCLSCSQGFTYNATSNSCIQVSPCPFGQYQDTSGNCVKYCQSGLYYKFACVASCPSGYTNNNFGGCIEDSSTLFCSAPLFRLGNNCVGFCPVGYWPNLATRVCDLCDSKCQSCISTSYCLSCKSGYTLAVDNSCVATANCAPNQIQYLGRCFNSCPAGTQAINGLCQRACPQSTYYLNGFCYPTCPVGNQLRTADACVAVCPPGTTEANQICTYA